MPTSIRESDLIEGVAAALRRLSGDHAKMRAQGRLPIRQDAGMVDVFLKIGMDVRFEGFRGSIEDAVNEGVRRGHLDPAVVHMAVVPGNTVDVRVAAKGNCPENRGCFAMLKPSDSLVDWVLEAVPTLVAGRCLPGMLGIGVGGTAEKAMLMAREVLMDDLDMCRLLQRGPQSKLEALRVELYEKINALGIGAQALDGLITVLDVKIATHPTHAASKPAAIIADCPAARHAHFVLDGSGPTGIEAPSFDLEGVRSCR